MKNGTEPQEKISALADGELASNELDSVLASLRQPEARREWDIYHQIGDALRSDDMAVNLSPDFAARMKTKLDAEPVILAPAALAPKRTRGANNPITRYAVSGVAAAVAVFTAYLVAPQFNTDGGSKVEQVPAVSVLASDSGRVVDSTGSAPVLSINTSSNASASLDAGKEAVVLRDPAIDEYLVAHQRYSPSLYDTSQFVRSATFEADPKK